MERPTIDSILTEIGPLVEAGEVICLEGDGPDIWTIAFEDESTCQIEPIGEYGRHMLSSAVAPVPVEGKLELFETLLAYNDQVEQTGAVHMAIDAPDGDVIMSVMLDEEDIEAQALSAAIVSFRALRAHWVEVVKTWPAAAGDPDTLPPPIGGPGIRV
ncbi:MAG: type III secretion system chaperone [Pseudomonadota bacterium]